ncbi:hypothetical protein [Burkholderia anthina]|uniref:hypothetical protein n=1 Tax=Burkholderia anthina TaxID=179879 RepID=UPI00158E8432|nr:hypothetical protein [Burkholderia anthina]
MAHNFDTDVTSQEGMISEIDQMIIVASLNKMVKTGFFDICTLERCMELANISPPGSAMRRFQALHCVNFNDMPETLRTALLDAIRSCFQEASPRPFDDLFKAEPQPKQTPQHRILAFLGLTAAHAN